MTKSLAKTTASPAVSEKKAAEMFTTAFQDAVGGTRKLLVFGAMYSWLNTVLDVGSYGGPSAKGEGLKGWIETNCPKVNYNTAYKWHTIAKEIGESLKIPKGTDVYRLLTAKPHELAPKEQNIRREIDDAIEGRSANQLEIFLGIRKAPKLLGAPEGNQNARKDRTDDPAAQLEAAKLRVNMDCSKAVAKLGKLVDNKSIAFLGLQGMRILAEELERLAKITRDVLKETADGRKP